MPPPQDVRVEFGGDVPSFRLVAGTAEPGWLSVEVVSQLPGEMVLRLAPIGTALAADVYATLRLTMRPLRSGRPADSVDVPVASRVRAGMHVPQIEMVFQSIDGAASPHRGIGLTSDVPDESWSTAVEYAAGGATGWLLLPTDAGPFQDGTAQLVLGVGYAPPGLYFAAVVVRDRIGVVRGRIPVVYDVRRTYEIL